MIPGNANPLLLASAAADDAAAGPTKSLRFNSADTTYLSRSQSSGNSKTFTYAFWFKAPVSGTWPCIIGADSSSNERAHFRWNGTQLQCYFISGGIQVLNLQTNRVFRDKSAWYHIVLAFDTTQSTESDRAKLYVNGTQESSFAYNVYPSQNATVPINNSSSTAVIGRRNYDGSNYFNGYLADIYFIDGSALDPTSFGAFDSNGVWQAAAYSGTFGTNGFHLKFDDASSNAALGTDSSGNSNTWTVNNLTALADGATSFSSTNVTNPSNILDGDTSTGAVFTSTNAVFDVTCNITGITQLEFLIYDGSPDSLGQMQYRVNGGSYVNASYNNTNNYVWNDATSLLTNSTLTSFGFKLSGSPNGGAKAARYTTSAGTFYILDTPFSGIDSLFDVPTNGTQSDTGAGGEVSGNYCTLNPLDHIGATFSNGNLDVSLSSGNHIACGTIGMPFAPGKYYWEVTVTSSGSTVPIMIGMANVAEDLSDRLFQEDGWYYYGSNGQKYREGSGSSYGASYGNGDVIGVAVNCEFGSQDLTFYKNGVSQGTAYSSSFYNWNNKTVVPVVNNPNSGQTVSVSCNFGQRPFAYSAPSGYKTLNTVSLPTPTIADGSDYFDTKLFTGNGSTQTISGLSMSPDWVWIKTRATSGLHHYLLDTVRGATNRLISNGNFAESSVVQSLTAFNADGFTVGSDGSVNKNNDAFVAWTWDAGANSNKTYSVKVVSDSGNKYRFDDFGTSAVTLDLAEGSTYVFDQSDSSNSGHPLRFSTTSDGTHGGGSEYTTGVTATGTPGSAGAKTTIVVAASAPTLYYYCTNHSGMGGQANTNSTAGASNFDGSIQATVKANQTAGFSVATFTTPSSGTFTFGHKLSAAPELIIAKARNQTYSWIVYAKPVGNTKYLVLNSTAAQATGAVWNNTTPTSSVVSGNASNFGTSTNYVAYCISPVAGYSAVGSYEANGSADGPFVSTSFRPALVICKSIDQAQPWQIFDSARGPENVITKGLQASSSGAEYDTTARIDFLSNGFKIRAGGGSEPNVSGNTYIYYAVAENPFQANGGLAR